MHATIPTYYLYSLDAIPADVIVGPGSIRVVERGAAACRLRSRSRISACKQAHQADLVDWNPE
jgi:hypothetical protein